MIWGPKNVKVKPMTMNAKYYICSSLCRVLFLSTFLRLLVKDAKHKHSFPNNFRTSYLCLNIFQKKEYTHPRDLWLITNSLTILLLLCYLIIFTLIIINWSYSYSVEIGEDCFPFHPSTCWCMILYLYLYLYLDMKRQSHEFCHLYT